MVLPPTDLLLFSSLCKHWLLSRLGHLVPVKWHWLYNHSIASAFQMWSAHVLLWRLCTVTHVSQQHSGQHQIMWAVLHDGQSFGGVSMHQLLQMFRPVCLLFFTQFATHQQQCLMGSLYLSISLGVIRQSSCLSNAHELTQFTDNVTQEHGQCCKDQDVFLPQESSNSFLQSDLESHMP